MLVCPSPGNEKGSMLLMQMNIRSPSPGESGPGIPDNERPRDRYHRRGTALQQDRVIGTATRLKQEFGEKHHIHLYTGTAPDKVTLASLKGLVDEIRLHPPEEEWPEFLSGSYAESVRDAKEMGFDIGVEVPALPSVGELEPALGILDFLNINELEWGDTNAGG